MKQKIIINGVQFTVWAESTGIAVMMERDGVVLGETLTECFEDKAQAVVYKGADGENPIILSF